VIIHFIGGGILLFWIGVLVRVERTRRVNRWRLGPDAPVDVPLPRLQVVVPARDEAANIAACIAALRASDHPAVEILVFDDASSDGTGDLAEAAGAVVLRGRGGELPEGWKGKPWALWRATRELDAPWVLFVDADVRVAPEALSRAHAYAIREEADLLSGFGRLVMGSFWERVIQPSVGGLILAGNDLDRVNDPKRPEDLVANGQFILVRREVYEAAGGHGAVRGDILDDIGLARAVHRAGGKVRLVFMRELFACRMYTSFRELWLGWTKNLYAGVHHKVGTVLFLCGLVLFEFVLPYVMLVAGALSGDLALLGWGAALVLVIQGIRFHMDRIFGQEPAYGLLQVLGATLLVGLLVDSVRRSRGGSVIWKGRTYTVRPEQDTLRG
jgi:chlorobactene glucosyltransferase